DHHHRDLHSFPTRRSSDLDLNIGDLGGGDLEDVQYAAKHAQQVLGLKSKPAAVGGSYGGYLTLMALMIHPDDWAGGVAIAPPTRSEEHTSELQSRFDLVCR